MWTEVEATDLPAMDDFYLVKRPEITRNRVFCLGHSPQEHILAWQAFANEGAAFGYGSSGVIPFYDFLNSVKEAVPTLILASRRLSLHERTLGNAIAMFREHLPCALALHQQRRRDGEVHRF